MQKKFTDSIAARLGNPNVYLYWKGRVALYALLKAMNIKAGDEVILPAYTCVVVPNAIIYLGAKPVYVDIDPDTFNMNVDLVPSAITNKTKAILLQNTYGLSSNIEQLVNLAKEDKIYTIEDCTHGYGGTYNGKPNGTFCDAAFFSSQWNKPFSTGIGGFSVVYNETLTSNLEKENKTLLAPSFTEKLNIKLQLVARKHLLNEITYWSALKFYRFLSKKNIVVGSSRREEIEGIEMPDDFFKRFTNTQAREGIKAMRTLDSNLALRKKNAKKYTDFLFKHNKNHVHQQLEKNHSFLKYPLLVKDREKFMAAAEESQIMLGDWFTSPIHPVNKNHEAWGFDTQAHPIATNQASKVINLPTDIKPGQVVKTLDFLTKNLTEIESLRS